jgi:valyl-tRNA synthetase
LQQIVIMNRDATMSEAAGRYAGLDRFECRKQLWADMEAAGLAIETKPYTNRCAALAAMRCASRRRAVACLHAACCLQLRA